MTEKQAIHPDLIYIMLLNRNEPRDYEPIEHEVSERLFAWDREHGIETETRENGYRRYQAWWDTLPEDSRFRQVRRFNTLNARIVSQLRKLLETK